jgi:feruloyl esterase
MMNNGKRVLVGGALLAFSAAVSTSTASPESANNRESDGSQCAVWLSDFGLPGHDLRIASLERVPDVPPGTLRPNAVTPPVEVPIPGYCRVRGVIDPRKGVDGVDYGLRFELALPDDWNGRFLFQGGGGFNGALDPALGATAAGRVPALARGFAVVSTDSGHASSFVFDAAFMKDQRAALDFALHSVPTVTLTAKAMLAAYYGKSAHHSYLTGCSTGGREGMLAAQRYPELFDGVVAGAPAMRPLFARLGVRHAEVIFNQAAPRDAEGRPVVPQILSAADRELIARGLLEQCDALDGLADGVIHNMSACRFNPSKLQCSGGLTAGCLSTAQAKAVKDAFEGPRDRSGELVYPGFPYDTGITATGPLVPGFLPTGQPGVFGPANRELTLDVDEAAWVVRRDPVEMLTNTDQWTNLSTFLGRGGKIIFYHGVSDPWFSAWDTLDYWQRAAKDNAAAWHGASRLYMVPGMGHCGGGSNAFDSFDLLDAVVNWVEKGVAPEAVLSERRIPGLARRPMCPWPTYARYIGGDVTEPTSFHCASE